MGLNVRDCAEWNSLDQCADRSRSVRAADQTWLFVSSDTEDGLRSAALTAIHQARRENVPLYYLSHPELQIERLFRRGSSYLVRIPELDLVPVGGAQLGAETWLGMGDLGRIVALTAMQSPVEVVFHLSGGYKALLSYFLLVAEGVRTVLLGDGASSVRAYCLHESSDQPIPVPVRWLRGAFLEDLEDVSRDAGTAGISVSSATATDLVGVYLDDEVKQGRRRLTEAGMIMARTLWALNAKA